MFISKNCKTTGVLYYLKKKFNEHPNLINETYGQHFCYAIRTAFKLIGIAFVLSIHAFFPFLFQTTASRMLKKINEEIQKRSNLSIE